MGRAGAEGKGGEGEEENCVGLKAFLRTEYKHSIQPLYLTTPAFVLHLTAAGQGQQQSRVNRSVYRESNSMQNITTLLRPVLNKPLTM